MAFLEKVRYWHEGVVAFQEDRFQDCLLSFNQIEEPSARILFNIGCVFQRIGREKDCILNLTEAIKKDPHLAAAYFHRAVQCIKTKRFRDALEDLDRAEQSLRGASFINYSQLGLNFTLYKFEVVFNRAICCAYQQDIRTAVHMLIEAGKVADEELHTRISVQAIQDLTLIKEDGMKGKLPSSFKPFEIPSDCVFQPPRDMVANLGKQEYVAKSKVLCTYGERKNPPVKSEKVITGTTSPVSAEPTVVRILAPRPRTPPLPRRPLPPPPPSDLRVSKSVGDLVTEMKREEALPEIVKPPSIDKKLAVGNELANALNARFKNMYSNSNNASQKPPHMSNTPTRPPRRPPPPALSKQPSKDVSKENDDSPLLPVKSSVSKTTKKDNLKVNGRSPNLPVKSSSILSRGLPPTPQDLSSPSDIPKKSSESPPLPARTSPRPSLGSTSSSTRNIPPPPSYKPPPPPPNFKAPPPPVKQNEPLVPLPPKKKGGFL